MNTTLETTTATHRRQFLRQLATHSTANPSQSLEARGTASPLVVLGGLLLVAAMWLGMGIVLGGAVRRPVEAVGGEGGSTSTTSTTTAGGAP